MQGQSGVQRWPAPAKLNLLLRITGRRADGYHLLQSVFQLIDLCDWLTYELLEEDLVTLVEPIPGVPEQDDLTVRAANLLKQESGFRQGVKIGIEKNLPMGGGLGGGSSDAATTLLALNHLWGLGFSVEQLMQFGLRLGADVPVFVYGYSAWAEGVGEKLSPIMLPEDWFLIVKPDCHVNTRQIFLTDELTRDSKLITIADFTEGLVDNDCTSVVRKLYPEVDKALIELSKFGYARLTGTGACVFAQYQDKNEALQASLKVRHLGQVFVAKGLNRSPVFGMLSQE
ncbi:MAG: 4-(cytidine 5'-diphospho)-2-C-methyl-D-erythritol kinase [Methylococcaceae bacterium]|nr:4-(cytidine 5'-diphospho)-2-C-methyl-D-erythritol kinase [Methylococcaceae bacterium]